MARLPLPPKIKVVPAVVPSAGAVASMTAIAVDATGGYDRVCFVLTTGAAATGATISFKIQSSATSGGSYADVTSAALTNLAAANDASKVFVVDIPVTAAKPFFKVVGAVGTDTFANGTIAILYNGDSLPVATTYAAQAVIL